MGRPTREQQVEIARRRDRALRMRLDGIPWQAIVDELGYASTGHACDDIKRALEVSLKEMSLSAGQLREQEAARLDAAMVKVLEVINRPHPLVQGGKVVTDGDGNELLDDGPVLAGVDRLIKIAQRRAALLGLDAPTQVNAGVTVRFEVAGVDEAEMP
jgi:hypothetical protein